MTKRPNRRPVGWEARLRNQVAQLEIQQGQHLERMTMVSRARARLSWFKPPAPQVFLSAGRVEISGVSVGKYGGAKERAHAFAQQAGTAADWAARELHRPKSALNMGTARFCGKPYHWRQDYTGQLKLAAGESPW